MNDSSASLSKFMLMGEVKPRGGFVRRSPYFFFSTPSSRADFESADAATSTPPSVSSSVPHGRLRICGHSVVVDPSLSCRVRSEYERFCFNEEHFAGVDWKDKRSASASFDVGATFVSRGS